MLIKGLCSTLHKLRFINTQHSFSSQLKMGLPSQEIVKSLLSFAPLSLAEKWDNVGLLIDPMRESNVDKILLTNDLSEDVVDEAINIKAGFIITYHPIIFQGLKSVSASNSWKERVVVKCVKNEIVVFSPHTSWDCTDGGVNDWLAAAFDFKSIAPIKLCPESATLGAGRIIQLRAPISVQNVVDSVKKHVGIGHLRLSLARNGGLDSLVSTIALCAGSGGSVLKGTEVDLYLTGEMSHHEVLDASQSGIHVILCEHSNSERGFLKLFQQVLMTKLLANSGVDVVVSNVDKDPLSTL